jgi:nucleotide-binding universal stress UspA family protein
MLKTILVATDFSKNARNASLYAIELAKAFDARVVLFHAFQVPIAFTDGATMMTSHEMIDQVRTQLDAEATEIDPSNQLSIITVCKETKTLPGLLRTAKALSADLIIIGMKTKGHSRHQLFGSTASGLINEINIPFLVIPETAQYSIPRVITLASDIQEEMETNIHLLYFLRQMAEKFESSILVVQVIKEKMSIAEESTRTSVHRLNHLLVNLDVKYEYSNNRNITDALMDFVKTNNSDILVMIPHKHDFFERIFVKSDTKDMLFHTQVPLLLLPEVPDTKQDNKVQEAHHL